MQQQKNEQTWASSRRVMLVMMSLSTLYNYLYSMTVSSTYGLLPILGGALFMSGAVASAYAQTFLGENRKYLNRRMRVTGTLILVLMLLFSLALFSIYPIFSSPPTMWALFTVVLALTMRSIIGRRLVGNVMRGRIGKPAFLWFYIALQIVPAGVVAILLFSTLPSLTAWQTLGGFGLSVLLESYTLWRERRVIAMERETDEVDQATVERMANELRTVHAYSAYQRLHMLILMALQVTLVMVYTFFGVTTGEIVACLSLSVGCTIIMREATDFLLARLKRRRPRHASTSAHRPFPVGIRSGAVLSPAIQHAQPAAQLSDAGSVFQRAFHFHHMPCAAGAGNDRRCGIRSSKPHARL